MGKRGVRSRRGGGDYEIGYGRPPKATQFKKGTSGNPGGKPKTARSQTPGSLLRAALMRPITVKEDGIPRTMTALELIYLNLTRAAARGDLKAAQILYRELQRYPPAAEIAEANPHDHGAEVRRKLNDMCQRMAENRLLDAQAGADAEAKHESLQDDLPRERHDPNS